MEEDTDMESEFPTVMIAMTEAIPMIMPSIVRNVRERFAFKLVNASLIFSRNIVINSNSLPFLL